MFSWAVVGGEGGGGEVREKKKGREKAGTKEGTFYIRHLRVEER